MYAKKVYESAAPFNVNYNVATDLGEVDLGKMATNLPEYFRLFVYCISVTGTPTSADIRIAGTIGSTDYIMVDLANYTGSSHINADGDLHFVPADAAVGYCTPPIMNTSDVCTLIGQGAGCDGSHYFRFIIEVYAYYK